VPYLVNVKDEKLAPGSEVEDARFFDIAELPGYYSFFLKDIIEEIQNQEVF